MLMFEAHGFFLALSSWSTGWAKNNSSFLMHDKPNQPIFSFKGVLDKACEEVCVLEVCKSVRVKGRKELHIPLPIFACLLICRF